MALVDQINLFTQALNVAFVNGYEQIAEPAPIETAMTIVPSKGKIENYPWLYPPPLMHQWEGFRSFARLGSTNYRVPNKTYTTEFEVLLEDLQDDQIDGFRIQAAALGQGAKEWPGIEVLRHLANGQTDLCFDGTPFFAPSHVVGTGNNVFIAPTVGTDAKTHVFAALVIKNKLVKPMMWQMRDGPNFRGNEGTDESSKIRKVQWWADLRGAAAFGFWWDAILCKFANTPTLPEMQTALGMTNALFRQFIYPKNLPSDVNQYPHGQTKFTDKTLLIVCSSGIEHILRQALTLSLIAQTENYFKGFADLVCSGYLDLVV